MPLFRHKGSPSDRPDGVNRLSMPGIVSYATHEGWQPAGDKPFTGDLPEWIHDAAKALLGVPGGYGSRGIRVPPPIYVDAYTGEEAGLPFTIANAWTSVFELKALAVCQLRLATAVPLVWIDPHGGSTLVGRMVHEVVADPTDFDQTFRVTAPDKAAAEALLTPVTRSALMAREHWTFQIALDQLVCVTLPGLESADDVIALLRDVRSVVAGFPPGDAPPPPLPISPDGTKPDREAVKAALRAMTPQQRLQAAAELRRRYGDDTPEARA